MKRTIFLTAFVGLLAISLTSCGTASLKTIDLSASANSTGGFFELKGEGSTIQLTATGNYTYGPTKDLSNLVTYTVTPDGVDSNFFQALPAPPEDITISKTGLLTAVDPFVCTYQDVGTPTLAVWVLTGSYKVVATYRGVSSQPVYVGMASAAGPAVSPDPGACGP
ncbi:MAG TPA: hypothetical protein VKR60_14800 [Candidatus Sulfotelmatobacter sp.]|nr:hypothetical protein [Candidatus Sulfotelmatobacter sp.]